jgi:hypothetical protein
MTRQESFKRRVRARMEHTGERYAEARRVLIEQADRRRGRTRVAEPELGDQAVREATGRDWDAWCDLIDAWDGDKDDHGALAAHLVDDHGVEGWWSQTIAVGYERITGRRLPYQRSDGTFSATRSRTVSTDPAELRALLLDDADRADLLPGLATKLRSRPTSKNLRFAVGDETTGDDGTVEIAMTSRDDGRVTVHIEHARLAGPDQVEPWKAYWGEWLEAIDDA